MKTLESTGKTVDEAIYNGLVELGLSIDEVEIEIIKEGSKGLFGLGSKVQVRLTEKEHGSLLDQLFADDEPATIPPKKETQGPPIKSAAPAAPRPPRAASPVTDRRRESNHARGNPRERSRQMRERLPERVVFTAPGTLLEDSADADYLYEVLKLMGMPETKIEPYQSEDGTVTLVLSGPGMGVLIGRRGETLNALQYLVSIYANKGDGDYRRLVVDTENYRVKREIALKKLARRKADEVKMTGHSISMEPMSAQERRVMHAEIQNISGVMTQSEGDEPNRYVVIKLEK